MIRKSTGIILALFVALVGFAFVLNQRSQASISETTVTPPADKAFPTEALANLLEISYINSNGNVLHIMKQKSGNWTFAADAQKQINQARIFEIISNLNSLEAHSKVTAASRPEDLGLSPPLQQIILKNGQDQSSRIKIGSLTPTNSGYYFQADDDGVVIVGKGGMETIFSLLSEDNLILQTTNSP
jgi:hypothetical protein